MNDSRKLNLHFQRFEMKYLINPEQEEDIRSFLISHLTPDPFAGPGGTYEVLSLYYDSPLFYYYHEKIDGVSKRKKVRLRTYRRRDEPSSDVFLEIKRRHDAVIKKDRLRLAPDEKGDFTLPANLSRFLDKEDPSATSLLEELTWESNTRSLGPKVLVAYYREPYLGLHNPNVRITFDRNIRGEHSEVLKDLSSASHDVSPGLGVMELKFNGSLPSYLGDVIRRHNLSRVAFSKYCQTLEACASLSALRIGAGSRLSNMTNYLYE